VGRDPVSGDLGAGSDEMYVGFTRLAEVISRVFGASSAVAHRHFVTTRDPRAVGTGLAFAREAAVASNQVNNPVAARRWRSQSSRSLYRSVVLNRAVAQDGRNTSAPLVFAVQTIACAKFHASAMRGLLSSKMLPMETLALGFRWKRGPLGPRTGKLRNGALAPGLSRRTHRGRAGLLPRDSAKFQGGRSRRARPNRQQTKEQ